MPTLEELVKLQTIVKISQEENIYLHILKMCLH